MTNDHYIRVGVVGAGGFAEVCHVPGVQAHPRGEVVALCARNRERVEAMAVRLGVPEVYTDYHELIARAAVDAITIATPDALHLPVAVAALEAGKHVFCEKPLAMNVEEARHMTDLAERSGLVTMVAFTFRYARSLRTLRRLIREGAIGTPFYVAMQVHWGGIGFPGSSLTWRESSELSTAGIWGDGASHLFDTLAFALAPAQEVCAQMMIVPRVGADAIGTSAVGVATRGHPPRPDQVSRQPDNVDLAECLARLRLPAESGNGDDGRLSGFADREEGVVHVSLLTSRVEQPRTSGDSIYVVGTRGALDISLTRGQHERVSMLRAGERVWEDIPLSDGASPDEPVALARMMGAFVDAVLRGHLEPEDPGFQAGLHAQEAIDAALRSAQSGCWERVAH